MTPETEEKIVRQLITFEELVKHLSTKEDLQKLRVEMILWIIGTKIAVGGGILWYVTGHFSQLYLFLQHWKPGP
jgi:hypothetical protein